jgi:hypothetical protein
MVEITRKSTVSLTLSDQDARDLWMTLDEALWATAQPLAQDGMPFNWRGNPGLLAALRDQLGTLYAPVSTMPLLPGIAMPVAQLPQY